MARTRIFKSGNSQAVRLPADIAYKNTNGEFEISRVGDVVTLYPARPSLKDGIAKLKQMPKPPRLEKRTPIDIPKRKND